MLEADVGDLRLTGATHKCQVGAHSVEEVQKSGVGWVIHVSVFAVMGEYVIAIRRSQAASYIK